MKRLLSLCIALTAMLCVNAQGLQLAQSKQIQHDKKFERTINSRMGTKPASTKQSKELSMRMAPMSQAKKAAAETVECPYDEWAIQDYGSDLWFNAIDLQKEHWFYFDVYASLYSLQMGKEYTLNDMDAAYTYVQDLWTYEKDFVTEVTFIPGDYGRPIPGFEAWCTTESGASYHVFYQAPEVPEEFTEVEVGELTSVGLKDLTATQGVFQFVGENSSYDFGITIKSEGQIEGNYTLEDVHGLDNYTYINDGIDPVKLYNVEMNVTRIAGDNNYHFDAKLWAYNGKLYIISGDYIEPQAEKTVDITATNLVIDDSVFDLYQQFAGYGVATLSADNGEYYITGYLYSYGDLLGHYRDDERSAQYWEITGPDGTTEVFSADFELVKTDGMWSIQGSVVGWDNVQYNLNLTGEAGDGKDPYDAQDGDIDVTYTLDEIEEFEVNIPEGYAYLSAASEERADTWFTFIYVDSEGLVPGTYPITSTYEPGTVQAGEVYNGGVYPTMYAYTDDEGYLTDMWYCTTGTVTVDYDADGNVSMECNAQNTNGLSVHVVVNPVSQGIKNVDATTSKDVYSVSGVRMNNAKDLKSGVYVVNGKKVVVK
ncbi:MAG: hypothetical protein Q4D33_06895 [Prevotellaceae bacterium]|nr:hypothetical protein [Prevotellaceae bacterium]